MEAGIFDGADSPLMRRTRLGTTDIEVSVQGLGCMGMAGWYSNRDDDEARTTIAALRTEYSLFYRQPELEIIPACRELHTGAAELTLSDVEIAKLEQAIDVETIAGERYPEYMLSRLNN